MGEWNRLNKYTYFLNTTSLIDRNEKFDIIPTQQENEMFKLKGSSLSGDKLSSFIRMIQASIPQESLSNINANTKISIDINRRVCDHFSQRYS